MASAKLKDSPVDAPLYEADFYSWTIAQSAALREGRLAALDLRNLAEEIEDLGKETFHKLRSSYRVILIHLLKWDHQPERRSRSWASSIKTHRLEIEDLLTENPSLRPRREEAVQRAYLQARVRAASEMRRAEASLPPQCPYSLAEISGRPVEWSEG